jgi:hypothetical protein
MRRAYISYFFSIRVDANHRQEKSVGRTAMIGRSQDPPTRDSVLPPLEDLKRKDKG